jgi:hypothetical protein
MAKRKFIVDETPLTPRGLKFHGREIARYMEDQGTQSVPLEQLVQRKQVLRTPTLLTIGHLISPSLASAFTEYMRLENQPLKSRFVTLNDFYDRTKGALNFMKEEDADIAFISMRNRSSGPADVIVTISPETHKKLHDLLLQGKIDCALPPAALSDTGKRTTNMDAEGNLLASTYLFNHIAEVERRASDELLTFTPDRRYCIMKCPMALKLRTVAFPEDGSVIVDMDTRELVNTGGKEKLDALIDQGKFVRISSFTTGENLFSVLPGAFGEFIQLHPTDNSVVGVKSVPHLDFVFNVRASVHSDFSGKFFIHLIPHQERTHLGREHKIELPVGEASLAQQHIESAPADTPAMTIFGQPMRLVSTWPHRLKHQDATALHFDADADIHVKANRNGTMQDLRLEFRDRSSLVSLSMTAAKTISVCINSTVYDFERA